VNVSRGLITARVSRDEPTIIEAALVPGGTATLGWAARLGPQMQVLVVDHRRPTTEKSSALRQRAQTLGSFHEVPMPAIQDGGSNSMQPQILGSHLPVAIPVAIHVRFLLRLPGGRE
jgi:hypothetical protein